MMKWSISEKYGCWVAETSFGFSIWARSKEELESAFKNN